MSRQTNRARGGSVHQTSDTERRDAEPVHEEAAADAWLPGGSLAMPPARDGKDQRWIRVEMGGKFDSTNWSRKQREGWRARPAETVAEDFPVPKIEQGRFAGYIGVHDQILCERPMAMSKRREKFFRERTQVRTNAINAALDKVNQQNRNPAFGPIRMASESKLVREVPVQTDE